MMVRVRQSPRRGETSWIDVIAMWALIALDVVAVLLSTNAVFDRNLYLYGSGVCGTGRPHGVCSNSGFLVSMPLSFFGGIASVLVGARLGFRARRRGRAGAWFPLCALGAVLALSGLAIVVVRTATGTW